MRVQEGREVPQALLEAPQSRGQSRRVKVHLQIDCQLLRGPAKRFIQILCGHGHVTMLAASDSLGGHVYVSMNFATPHRILGCGIIGDNGAVAVVAFRTFQR